MALNKALGTDLSALAQIIQSKGRGKDTVLAHITPQEAALLKKRGGRGSTNPDTGLPEFELDDDLGIAGASPATEAGPASSEGSFQLGSARTPEQAAQNVGFGYQVGSDLSQPAPTFGGYSGEAIPTGSAAQAISSDISPQFQINQPLSAQAFGLPAGTTAPQFKPEEVAATKPEQAGFLDKALAGLGKPDTLGRLGLTGALGAYGAMQGKQAASQNAQAVGQKSAIAAPYKQQGQELIGAAQRGELTPANQQVIQQQRARLAQAASNMGGVGQQQIENQISTLTSQLIENQYKYGLQVLQIGDNIELGAINTQLQLDQKLNQANKSFYTSLAQLAAGSPMYVPGLTSVTPTRT
jgi:hypothetical protein